MKKLYRRYVEFVALLGVMISVLAYLRLDADHREHVTERFQQKIDRVAASLERELNLSFETVRFVKSLYEASEFVSADEFKRFTRETLVNNETVAKIAWVPRVSAEERGRFELDRQAELPGFEIRETSPDGRLQRAPQRSEYLPLYYLEPPAEQGDWLGADLAADEPMRASLIHARASGQQVAIYREGGEKEGSAVQELWVFTPVYQKHPQSDTGLFNSLQGFVLAVFRVADMVNASLIATDVTDIRLQLFESSVSGQRKLLYTSADSTDRDLEVKSKYSKALQDIGGRSLLFEAVPERDYMGAANNAVAGMALIFGLAFTLLVTVYMLIVSKREVKIQEIVDQRTKELHALNQKLELMTLTDALTGVVNRRGLDQVLEIEWSRSIREQVPITLLIIDVDYFKYYNDHYGHLAGDECLKQVATAIAEVPLRLGDLVARYGGEEFAVMLPNTDDRDDVVANKCRAAVESLAIEHGYSPIAESITVSIGVATLWPARSSSYVELIQAADDAMYLAKSEGRNRVAKAQTVSPDVA